ncbi:nitronate monooxygenase [Sneathiella marina]|uniref:Nitronate monooxygenase n=1 Tax=Sneathiella marina TaxID=2950108 RepID=A0ABY4W4F7_9PROT|nr:nitronate monooxygenase [Sneathiella marina]USG61923.1 nitronate monooxygenase [Sneathiella marina]
MSLPSAIQRNLKIPAIAAPLFLISGPDLVIASCKAGVIGSFPAMNARSSEDFSEWMEKINKQVTSNHAPYAVNFSLARMKGVRLDTDMETCRKHKTPIIITSVGNPAPVVEDIHAWGGLVFHDVTTMYHAKKAADAGVDGLILVCNGAGGHAGPLSPFAMVEQVRTFFDGTIILAGAISSGRGIRAAEILGADLAYLGTRFIATTEALAEEAYKNMIVTEKTDDIVYTNAISGVPANFMRTSLNAVGLDPDNLPAPDGPFRPNLPDGLTAWNAIWSAGQGVGLIDDLPDTAELVSRLSKEYQSARQLD